MTKIYDKEIFKQTPIDLLVGGTPCQSFSLAGSREGLDDSRGDLALEFCRIAKTKQPRWIVWENVPGVLSASKGEDFKKIIGEMSKLRYGVCWRILDAQNFGVPQRRRRVFVVGYLGDWKPAAAVLFERTCFERNNKKGSKSENEIAGTIKSGYHKCWNDLANIVNIVPQGKYGRRLTPLECERLQGFEDNYTAIPNAKDSDRYKAIGNSMAVPVMHWLGERIELVETLKEELCQKQKNY
jgi:DNA (cytosine-5)-methyltransferase 1